MNKMPFLYTFGVGRSIDILDPENHSGSRSVKIRTWSGDLGLTEEVSYQKYENQKEDPYNYLK